MLGVSLVKQQRSLRSHGTYHIIFQEVRHDAQSCRKFIRMDNYRFLYLVDRLSGDLQKEDTFLKKCISPEELICLTRILIS